MIRNLKTMPFTQTEMLLIENTNWILFKLKAVWNELTGRKTIVKLGDVTFNTELWVLMYCVILLLYCVYSYQYDGLLHNVLFHFQLYSC